MGKQTRRPLPRKQAAFKRAALCMRNWSVYGGAVGWHRCPAVQHTKHTPAAPNSFNAHSDLIMTTVRMQRLTNTKRE